MQSIDSSEFVTRKKYIDIELRNLGWTFSDNVLEEVPLVGMPGDSGDGFADYVLYGKDGLPLAVVEAKRTSKDPTVGTHQAKLYADCLENMCGRRPIMFTTNGFETYIWDDLTSPQRKVSGLFCQAELQKLINRRDEKKDLSVVAIDNKITDRYYQKAAITAVCEDIEKGVRRHLLVMATSTGKTRTASSLTDVLSRGGYITNILFLADRTALVRQAKNDFKTHLPHMSLCNLLSSKDDKTARIVFSTYPTILNAIDREKGAEAKRFFTPAYFDLIIIDEAHRSIFKKYKAIFEYFDSYLVGLTATPKTEVDRNTYDFFELKSGMPTYAYDYDTAVYTDHVLVPYHNIEVKTKFLDEGIRYEDLSPEDKERYEEDFTDEDGEMPDFIPSPEINTFIFNQSTVDMVLEDLMNKGIKVAGGDRIGKTIIFAQTKEHAKYIVERFDKLYPQYKGSFAKRIVCGEDYAQNLIDNFKIADKQPHIAVSVDMMDTGIDVPEIVNLVFFKKVRSKTKFWQMIGRGTRLCKDLFGIGEDKKCFYIFDYLSNFEFFREKPKGIETNEAQSISEAIFIKRVRLIEHLQYSAFMDEPYQEMRNTLVETALFQINSLNTELVSVKLQARHVEYYKKSAAFISLSETDKSNLINHIAPIVYMDDMDEYAKRFDNFMYGIMLAFIEQMPQFKKGKKQLINISHALQKKMTIPQVKEKAELIKMVSEDAFWQAPDVLAFEEVRLLRSLIRFIIDDGGKDPVYTNLLDIVVDVQEGVKMPQDDDLIEYKTKVNRYIEEHKDHISIAKLRNNIPLTDADYKSLENILIGELGSAEDYCFLHQLLLHQLDDEGINPLCIIQMLRC